MKSVSHNTLIVPKFIFSSLKEFFFVELLLLFVLQPLVSQEYVSQSFHITSYDPKYNIPLKSLKMKLVFYGTQHTMDWFMS